MDGENGNAGTARVTLLFCFLSALCEGVDVQAAGVAAAGLAREFSLTPGQLGAFFSASNVGLLFGAIVGGRLADRLGRKAVVLASIVTFGVAALSQAAFNVSGAAVAWGVGQLLDMRWRRLAIVGSVVGLPTALVAIANAPVHPGLLIGLASLLGGSVLAAQVILYGVAGSCYSAQARGTGVGAAVSAGRIGSLLGPLFASMLLRGGRTPTEVLMGVLPIVAAGLACVAAVAWRWPSVDLGRHGLALTARG
jgi:MFS transporter, AAHS family, 3-hydroxyphenylpropionic acid transporter